MKNTLNPPDREGRRFTFPHPTFPQISFEKLEVSNCDRLEIWELIKGLMFDNELYVPGLSSWLLLKSVIANFLRNKQCRMRQKFDEILKRYLK